MLFAIISVMLLILTSGLITAILRLSTPLGKIAALYVIAFAEIVLITEGLGSIYMLSNKWVWLLSQCLMLTIVAFVWKHANKPALGLHLQLPERLELINRIKQYPLLWTLGVWVAVAYGVGIGLILYVPPNNYDGLTYHLARVGYWLQYDSLYPWVTANVRQTTFPPNAEFAILWTILLRGTDQFAGFVQWTAALISAISVYGITRMMSATRAQSIFPALIYLSLSQIQLQSTTVQNDLVVSSFFVSAIYLFILGWRYKHRNTLIISSMALGLSVGAKSTAAFALPGLFCAVLIFWFVSSISQRRLIVFWGAACIVGTLLLGAYIYILNTAAYGYPLGIPGFVEGVTTSTSSHLSPDEEIIQAQYSRLETLAINIPRYLVQMADFSSMGSIGQEISQIKYDLFQRLFESTPVATAGTANQSDWQTTLSVWWGAHEDTSWFGPLGWMLFIPGIIYGIYRGARHRDPIALSLALIPVLFLILHSMFQPYTPAKGRYYVLAITIGAPLMVWPTLYRRNWRLFVLISTCLALTTIYVNTFHNASKPLLGSRTILNQDYITLQTSAETVSPQFATLVRMVNTYIPRNGSLGILVHGDLREYPFFVRGLTRTLVPIVVNPTNMNNFSLTDFQASGPMFYLTTLERKLPSRPVNGFLITHDYFEYFDIDTSGFELIADLDGHYLYQALNSDVARINSFREEFDDLPPGLNWHDAEGRIRNLMWTSDTQATIAARRFVDADRYQLTLRVAHVITQEIGESFQLLANQHAVELGPPDENGVYHASIPPDIIREADGWLSLTITTNAVISPHELGPSSDVRPLGVALDYLEIHADAADASIQSS